MTAYPRAAASALAVCLLVVTPFGAAGQEPDDEPLFGDLVERIKSPTFSIGALFQLVGDFQADRDFDGENGFSVANMRISFYGELDEGVGYFFQSNFGSVLDARLSWSPTSALTLDGGLFKTPFSAEFLTPASTLDFVDRSQGVRILAPGREVGLQARGRIGSSEVGWRAGIFNGNGGDLSGNEDGGFLYGGRLTFPVPEFGEVEAGDALVLGASFAGSSDEPTVRAGPPGVFQFDGVDILVGGDLRMTRGRLLISAEFLSGDMDDVPVVADPSPWGFHATVGFMATDRSQVLARWDQFEADLPGIEDGRLLLLGYNLWPTAVTELQVNLVVPVGDDPRDDPRLLVNTQLAF